MDKKCKGEVHKKNTWADVVSRSTPHKHANKMKQIEMSLQQQYGENYATVQWDMEDELMANEVEDLYVPPLPNQSHLQDNQALNSVKNTSKHDILDIHKVPNNLENDCETQENVASKGNSSALLDVSSNEKEIVSQFQDVLNIHSKKKNKKKRRSRDPLDMKLFDDCSMTQFDKIPWDIDGKNIYKIVSDKDFWIDEAHDGRWWKLSTSSRKGLKGERKFGKCVGSYICSNFQCSKLLAEGVTNKIDFKWEKGEGYTCISCGYYAKREYCRDLMAMEYDETTSILTVFHQGNHKCTLKPEIQATLE